MKKLVCLLIVLYPIFGFSQVNDDFEDGNINGWTESTLGHWAASTTSPINGTHSLKHNLTDIEGTSMITHNFQGITIENGETTWQFNFKNGSWNPSSSNYFGIFVFSDQIDFTSALNGYVVGVDFDGETDDFLTLWKVSNGTFTSIIQSDYVWPTSATLGVRIKRSAQGEWTLEYDTNGGFDNLLLGGNVTDNTHTNAFFTGAYFEYTSSRAGQFWVDDFSITGPPDINPPQIVNIETISNNKILVNFNENITPGTAETELNYSVNNSIGEPSTASLNLLNNRQVELTFTNTFTEDINYTLTVNNIEDNYGNTISSSNSEFSYFVIRPYDIVINEIMCDVNPPPIVLPAHEYIEIYNTSGHDVNLAGWTLQIGTNTPKNFSNLIIAPGKFAIICEDDAEVYFLSYGTTIPILVPDHLTTSGKRLIIRNEIATIIEDLTYSNTWYKDNVKDDGGWSLERIDPLNFCGEKDNWTASVESFGGTPGYINSVKKSNIDNTAPDLVSLKIASSNYLILSFNENISYLSGSNVLNFSVNNGINNPNQSYTNTENRKEVHLKFATQFTDKQSYTLIINDIKDNCDNKMLMTATNFTYHLIYPEKIWVTDEKQLKIKFSETVSLLTGTSINNYFCNNSVGNPYLAVREATDTTIVYLKFKNPFPDGQESRLSISGIRDINGNQLVSVDMPFIYYLPKPGDLVLNEILFNPFPYGADFVEIFNNSNYDIDLLYIQLANRSDKYPDSLYSLSALSKSNLILEPKNYAAFTIDRENVLTNYMSLDEGKLFEIAKMPSYNDDKGTALIAYNSKVVLDEFKYNEDMHFKLLDNKEGVSLERINPNKPTQDNSNWHSASEMVGFATPAYKNSQYSEGAGTGDDPISVFPYVFSPDNDGMDDYANIQFKFQNPGNVATVYIFDSKGRIVIQLANNLLLSTKGTIVWDGLYADYKIAPSGTYLVWFKVFDIEGQVKLYKKTVVLAKKV